MASVFGGGEPYLYSRLRELFRDKVRSGEWAEEQPIPSERELAGRYGVSRMTVRQAITELVDAGIFYREQGRGTFVARQPVGESPRLSDFSAEMRARTHRSASRLLSAELCPANQEIADRLRIKVGQVVVALRYLHLVDDEVIAHTHASISFLGCEALLSRDLAANSLYQILETDFDLPPLGAEQTIEARVADDEPAALLNVPPGSPLLVIRRITSTRRNRVIEYAISTYRGDRYAVSMQLDRERMSSLTALIDGQGRDRDRDRDQRPLEKGGLDTP
jgi:GntR family transcriptional regulator